MEFSLDQNKWLNQLSQAISQDEWIAGMELYRENRILKVDRFDHLIYGNIQTIEGKTEVRIKLHPSGRMIQWVECTCAKNRKKGIYCQHIAALFFHIHQERSDFTPETYLNAIPQSLPKNESETTQTIVHGLFQQGRGNILAIEAFGAQVQVRFEVKAGHASQIELDIDQQPSFLASLASIERKLLPESLANLKTLKDTAIQGIYFFIDDEDKLVGRKVLAIKKGPSKSSCETIEHFHEKVSVRSHETIEDVWMELFPVSKLSPFVGAKFLRLPQTGYIEITDFFENWGEVSDQLNFSDQEAIEIISNGFSSYRARGSIFLSKNLANLKIVHDITIDQVNVLQEKNGWFYLDPSYQSEHQSLTISNLIESYAKKKTPFLKSDKMWVRVPDIITQNSWSFDPAQKCLKVSNLELIKLKQSLGDKSRLTGKLELLEKIKDATEFNTPLNLPDLSHTKLNLRGYQQKGYEWLWWLYDRGLHGLLADDMGLGKTHQAMAVMSAIQSRPKTTERIMFLCICPTTVLDHWMDKLEHFAPNLKPLKYYGPKRDQLVKHFADRTTIVTSYGVLLRDIALLEKYQWEAVILDEAHFVKNNKTATYKSACRLNGKLRLCLSGTPMENRLSELKNIFDFVVPGYLGNDREFQKNYVVPIESHHVESKEHELRKLIHPLKLRRTKQQVLSDLPEKVEDTRHCWLSTEQVALYKDVLASKAAPLIHSLKEDKGPIPYLHVFTVLQYLKQICNHPALVRKSTNWRDGESGKFELFRALLSEALDSNHKVVIYSQYLGMIDLIRSYLTELNVGHVVLTGQSQRRGEIVAKFQNDPEVKVFVGSLLAGGVGIDLTAASVVIHYDRWWNASKENQATDRVHRFGQKNFTQVIKLVSRGTLEEKIDQMITQKANLFNRFLEKDEDAFKNLTREDLINLLQ